MLRYEVVVVVVATQNRITRALLETSRVSGSVYRKLRYWVNENPRFGSMKSSIQRQFLSNPSFSCQVSVCSGEPSYRLEHIFCMHACNMVRVW
jgi:hypothetical protein